MSEIKVNKISPRTACGTVTLGDSGDTFTIPSGATINNQGTAVNFGATGSASWVTTVKTNSDSGFTAVAGEGYFLNTTAGTISVNLPAGTAGAVVAFKDYAGTWDTNAVTLVQNGSDKIGGSTVNATLSTEGIAVTLVFIDSTQGWLVTDSGLQDEAPGPQYVTASGGTPTTDGDFKIHTFTGPGTFSVSCAGNAAGNNQIEYLVVAGGGGGGASYGGGAGAGGFRFASPSISPLTYPAKPLAAPTSITAAAQTYPITVGGGGSGSTNNPAPDATRGINSTFNSITAAGGGAGAYAPCGTSATPITPGGSGGGGSVSGAPARPGLPGGAGTGNTPPVSPAQGTNGGNAYCGNGFRSGGGGGAVVAGAPSPDGNAGGTGGDGAGMPTGFGANGVPCGSFRYYAGGGGGGGHSGSGLPAAAGGKGGGGASSPAPGTAGVAGTTNSGGGGGGGSHPQPSNNNGGNGGSGIVVIRYKFQN